MSHLILSSSQYLITLLFLQLCEFISQLWEKQNAYLKTVHTEIEILHNYPNIQWPPRPRPRLGRLAEWYAERRACYASEDAGARLAALEGIPSQTLAEAVQLPLSTTDARFEGLQTSLGSTRSLKFQWNDLTLDIWSLTRRKWLCMNCKKSVEDVNFWY